MRRSHAILVAMVCALSLSARGQAYVYAIVDHDWAIHYRTEQYGLIQTHFFPGDSTPYTKICFGSRQFTVRHTVWPVAGVIVIPLVCFAWLLTYGLGSLFKPDKKPPPPNPSPPP